VNERAESARLRAENDELKGMLAEVQKALDAAKGDVERYRALYEQSRPRCPKRVGGVELHLTICRDRTAKPCRRESGRLQSTA
jgi:hypothetical protein